MRSLLLRQITASLSPMKQKDYTTQESGYAAAQLETQESGVAN